MVGYVMYGMFDVRYVCLIDDRYVMYVCLFDGRYFMNVCLMVGMYVCMFV